MANIPKSQSGGRDDGISLLRLGLIASLIGCFGLAVLLQQSYNRPVPAYMQDDSGQIRKLRPVDPNYRSEQAVMRFAEQAYRDLRGWNWDTKTDQGGPNGIRADVAVALFKFSAPIAQEFRDTWEAQKVYETAYESKTSTTFVFNPSLIVSSENPYIVWIMGEMRQTSVAPQGMKLYKTFPFAVEFTIERISKENNKFNQEGLLITHARDLTVIERQELSQKAKARQ
jgi:hypothetical protein